MNEKQYYVVLKLLDVDDETIYLTIWNEEGVSDEPYFYPEKSEQTHKQAKNRFTKSELAEIMGGAIYKKEITDVYDAQTEQMGFPEWINPLIELVPVEDGE